MLRRLRLAVVTLVLALGALEVGLRVFVHFKGEPIGASESIEGEWEWADEHLRAGRPVLESTLAYDPGLGWRNAASLRQPDLTTNADGWRSTHEFERAKPPGRRRLVFVGDSYTFGFGLGDAQNFAALTQQRLGAGWEVLNFAVPGYGTDQQLLCYETVARQYDPDAVVLGFFLRDYTRNLQDFRTYAKPRFELEGEGLRLVGVPVIAPEELFGLYQRGERRVGGSPWRSWVWADISRKWARQCERRIDEDATGWQLVARMQQRFRDAVRHDGAHPLWLVIPTDDVVAGEDPAYEKLAELTVAHAAVLGLDCIDLAPLFRAHDETNPSHSFKRRPEEGGHLSVTGNVLVADALMGWLERRVSTD